MTKGGIKVHPLSMLSIEIYPKTNYDSFCNESNLSTWSSKDFPYNLIFRNKSLIAKKLTMS